MRRALVVVLLALLPPLLARADATDRLLTAAAEQALQRGDVTLALAWIPPGNEAAVREAFAKAQAVATTSPSAREVAAGFLAARLRGLRDTPIAESAPEPQGVEQAVTAALAGRSSAPIRRLIDCLSRRKLDRTLADVRRLSDYAEGDLAGARLYVRGYAALSAYATRLAVAAAAPVSERVSAGEDLHEQICACECPDCEGAACPPCSCVCIGSDPSCPRPDEVTWIRR